MPETITLTPENAPVNRRIIVDIRGTLLEDQVLEWSDGGLCFTNQHGWIDPKSPPAWYQVRELL